MAFDATANNLDGTYTGGVTLNQPGALIGDTSARFDGSTGYVDVGIRSSVNQLSNDFTIEAWIKTDKLTGDQNIIDNRTYSLPSIGGYGFGLKGSSLRYTSYGPKDYTTVSGVISSGIWQHVAVVLDATNDAHFYLNGSFVQTIQGSVPANPSLEPINIGRSPIDPFNTSQKYFDGGIDEVAIYGRSLMLEEIEEHYLAGVPLPLTGDMDCDLDVDFDDIGWFVLALRSESDYESLFGIPPELKGDIDGNGNHDFGDIDGFVDLLRGQGGTQLNAVPEPSALLLLVSGLASAGAFWLRIVTGNRCIVRALCH